MGRTDLHVEFGNLIASAIISVFFIILGFYTEKWISILGAIFLAGSIFLIMKRRRL